MKRTLEPSICVGAVSAGVGAVVERFVAAPADVEHDADCASGDVSFPSAMARPAGEEQSNVYGEQEGSDEDQLSHLNRRIAHRQRGTCKAARPPFKRIVSRIDFSAWPSGCERAFWWWEAELLVFTPRGALPLTATSWC